MRRILMLAALVSVCLGACSQNRSNEKKEMKKILVAYFSVSGVTEGVARSLAEVAGADLFKIEALQPYTSADLDWTDSGSRSSVEMNDMNIRPALGVKLPDIQEYDVIYIGFPIWWNTCPRIVNTFLESLDLGGRTLIPFATSGGSSIRQACSDLKASYPDVLWKEGRLLNHPSREDLAALHDEDDL